MMKRPLHVRLTQSFLLERYNVFPHSRSQDRMRDALTLQEKTYGCAGQVLESYHFPLPLIYGVIHL